MLDGLKAAFDADTTLTSILAGGIHLHRDIGELRKRHPASAWDANRKLLPTAVIRVDADNPVFGEPGAKVLDVSIHLHQAENYILVEKAGRLLQKMYHKRYVPPLNADPDYIAKVFPLQWVTTVRQLKDAAFNEPLQIVRFRIGYQIQGAECN